MMKPIIAIMRRPLSNTISTSRRRTTPVAMNTPKPTIAPKSSASLYTNCTTKEATIAITATTLR